VTFTVGMGPHHGIAKHISTSEGGTTTPKVLATATSALLRSAVTPLAIRRGMTAAAEHRHAGTDRSIHRRQKYAEAQNP